MNEARPGTVEARRAAPGKSASNDGPDRDLASAPRRPVNTAGVLGPQERREEHFTPVVVDRRAAAEGREGEAAGVGHGDQARSPVGLDERLGRADDLGAERRGRRCWLSRGPEARELAAGRAARARWIDTVVGDTRNTPLPAVGECSAERQEAGAVERDVREDRRGPPSLASMMDSSLVRISMVPSTRVPA